MKIWGKIVKNGHIIQNAIIENYDKEINRTKKVYKALDELCYAFDLERPIWLESNIQDFKWHSKVRFTKDSFVEHIDFDFLEFQVIEED